MKIKVVQRGGFAGIDTVLVDLDTVNVRAAQAQQLEAAIEQADFFRLPVRIASDDIVGADMFEYQVSVTDKERKHTIAFVVKDTAPEPLASILRAVEVQ